MNVFLDELAKAYPEDRILLVCDGAMRHKSASFGDSRTDDPFAFIPSYTPEMNPIEQI